MFLKVALEWLLLVNVALTMIGGLIPSGFLLSLPRDYFCPREVQLPHFKRQLCLASEMKLPLFLHCRNAFEDLVSVIKKHVEENGPIQGVVHTFDGSKKQCEEILDLGLYIGLNGCSLKNKMNLEVRFDIILFFNTFKTSLNETTVL